ncbi:MFS general substrate transporter [Mycena leptocephala]|nr:MFS general substrate transporter [Mycena leptocephala]
MAASHLSHSDDMESSPSSSDAGPFDSALKATSSDKLTPDISHFTLPKSQLPFTPPTFPEGGLRAWGTVAGAFLVQLCGFGYATAFGVYQDFYTRDYLTQSSPSAISWIGGINAFIVMSGGLIAGRLYDRGHFYLLLWGGSFLQCFSLFMLSLCKREQLYQIFLAQGLGLGIGAGTVFVPSVAVVSHYFQKRRALAMTIVASGSSLGAVVHPIMLNNTINRLGFATTVRASAGFVGGLLLIACLLMHPRLPPPTSHPPFWKSLPRFARDPSYVFAVIGMCGYTVGFYFTLFYLQLDAFTHGINQTLSFYSLVILNASSFVGRLSPGLFAHRIGVVTMATAAAGVSAVLILSLIAVKNVAGVVIFGVLWGYCAGVFVGLMAPILTLLTDDLGELGLRIGVGFAVAGLGALAGSPINGALLTAQFHWWRPALFSGIVTFIGFLFCIATIVALGRKKRAVATVHVGEKQLVEKAAEETA